jgi:hypothetical protein
MTDDTSRRLDRCGVCSLLGEAEANRLFGCLTAGLDLDSYGDLVAVEGIARDREPCFTCPHRECLVQG